MRWVLPRTPGVPSRRPAPAPWPRPAGPALCPLQLLPMPTPRCLPAALRVTGVWPLGPEVVQVLGRTPGRGHGLLSPRRGAPTFLVLSKGHGGRPWPARALATTWRPAHRRHCRRSATLLRLGSSTTSVASVMPRGWHYKTVCSPLAVIHSPIHMRLHARGHGQRVGDMLMLIWCGSVV